MSKCAKTPITKIWKASNFLPHLKKYICKLMYKFVFSMKKVCAMHVQIPFHTFRELGTL